LLFGALPALLAGRFDLHSALKASGQRETGRFASVRAILSGSQIALSLALLVGAVLLTSTLRNLYAVDTGFDIENVVALSLEEPDGLDGPALNAWRRDLLATIGGVPGVGRVALDLYGPLGSQMNGRMRLPETPLAEATMAAVFPVTPGWFEIVGLETMSGRTFGAPDWSPDGVARVLVTESLARRLFGRTDVVGQRFFGGMRGNEEVEVIGVTHDIRHAYAPEQPQDAMFMILDAAPLMPMLTALVETSSHDGAILRDIRSAVETIVPDKAVPDPVPVMNRVDNAHAEKRMFSRLLSLLSAFAVLLAAVGLYGTIAFDVNGRRREFGVRLALGARPNRIGFLVMRYAASVVGGGIALGLFVAYGLSQVLESRLFGVAPTDLRSYGLGAVLFATVAFVACIAPVLTAVRVNPVVTLKGE
jgi:predicted permease